MEYRPYIFSLLIITGILGSCLICGKAVSFDFKGSRDELRVNIKNDLLWDALRLPQTASSTKKGSNSLCCEKVKPLILSNTTYGVRLIDFFHFPTVNSVFGPISINAP